MPALNKQFVRQKLLVILLFLWCSSCSSAFTILQRQSSPRGRRYYDSSQPTLIVVPPVITRQSILVNNDAARLFLSSSSSRPNQQQQDDDDEDSESSLLQSGASTTVTRGAITTSVKKKKKKPKERNIRISVSTERKEQQAPQQSQPPTVEDDFALVQTLTATAIRERGTSDSLRALHHLAAMSVRRRLPFEFRTAKDNTTTNSVISHVPSLLPYQVTHQIWNRVTTMARKGWISTNPDSVDGLPSFHINLISNGRPVVAAMDNDDHDDDDAVAEVDEIDQSIRDLIQLTEPYIQETLLPRVQELVNSTDLQIGDVFLRRYGQDVVTKTTMEDKDDDEASSTATSRLGISAHYDAYSHVTAVIALDNVAAHGTNGLYTTNPASASTAGDSATTTTTTTSNHAALRRFFPLQCGDAVVHTWDVLHGVDVEPGIDRTSLIVWFTSPSPSSSLQDDDNNDDPYQTISPWLSNREDIDTNDVAQFVLASALESMTMTTVLEGVDLKQKSSSFDTTTTVTTSTSSSSTSTSTSGGMSMMQPQVSDDNDDNGSTMQMQDEQQPKQQYDYIDLYLESASRGNTFALTRLGGLCEEGLLFDDTTSSESRLQQVRAILNRLQQRHHHHPNGLSLPDGLFSTNDNYDNDHDSAKRLQMSLAKQFWLEGALRGNALAQRALADELMYEATSSSMATTNNNHHEDTDDGADDLRLFAAVLFGLAAAQQPSSSFSAHDALARMIELELALGRIQTEQDFMESPIVAIARAVQH